MKRRIIPWAVAALLSLAVPAWAYIEFHMTTGETVAGTVMLWMNGSTLAQPVSAANPLPVSGLSSAAPSDLTASGTITTTDAVVGAPASDGVFKSGASTSGSLVAIRNSGGSSSWSAGITGLTSGTLYFEGSPDSTNGTDGNWIATGGRQSGLTGVVIGLSATANGEYRGNAASFVWFRVRSVGALTGTPSVKLTLSPGTGGVFLTASLPTGSNAIGSATATASGAITNPAATTTRPANTTAYAQNQLIANNTVAGSVTVNSVAIANSAGGVLIPRVRLSTNKTSGWDAVVVRVRLWTAAPTYTNGDGGAYVIAAGSANLVGVYDVTLSQYGDGAIGIGTPNAGTVAAIKLASGTSVFWDMQYTGSAALTPASGQTFSLTAEALN